MTVANGQTAQVTATLNDEDLDEDGLPDYYEENGYRDGFGRWHTPDSSLIDTDGDGLSDALEWDTVDTDLLSADTDGDQYSRDYRPARPRPGGGAGRGGGTKSLAVCGAGETPSKTFGLLKLATFALPGPHPRGDKRCSDRNGAQAPSGAQPPRSTVRGESGENPDPAPTPSEVGMSSKQSPIIRNRCTRQRTMRSQQRRNVELTAPGHRTSRSSRETSVLPPPSPHAKCERSEHEKLSGFEGRLAVCSPGETSSTILANYWCLRVLELRFSHLRCSSSCQDGSRTHEPSHLG